MNTRTVTIEDTPELTLADYKSKNIEIADALRFKANRIYLGVVQDQGSYKFINRAVRGFSKSIAVHRASTPSKRKAAIGAIQKMALAASKARAGVIETIHAGSPRIDEYHLAMAGEPKLPTYAEIMHNVGK